VPENIEPCIERRYFSNVHYLALVCSDSTLSERLQARPLWRGTRDAAYIDGHIRFNRWFQEYDRQPAIERIDTTNTLPEVTVAQVSSWIDEHLELPTD
jgi:hypothetical protein